MGITSAQAALDFSSVFPDQSQMVKSGFAYSTLQSTEMCSGSACVVSSVTSSSVGERSRAWALVPDSFEQNT